jgi:hypothetical protein
MIRRLLLLVILVLTPTVAHGYALTCGDARALVLGSDRFGNGVVVGHLFGAADVFAGLYCYVRDPRCNCYASLFDRTDNAFPQAYGQQLTACADGDTAFGAALRAARDVCG